MNKKLIAKTQYLNAAFDQNLPAFAKAISITPENDELLMKRGTIYTVFDLKGGAGYDTELLSKVIHDVLHDSYFQSDNISPIQSLEKAIADVKEKVAHLTNESIRDDNPPAEFNLISGVLWGNVMYIVQYGIAHGYLVREGEIRPINTISEGGFSAASGVVKDGDVVIFCSYEFSKKYPPDKLLGMAITDEQLLHSEACVLIKFILDTTFTPNEQIDFGIEGIEVKKPSGSILKGFTDRLAGFKRTKRVETEKEPAVVSKPQEQNSPSTSSPAYVQTIYPSQSLKPSPDTKGLKLRTRKPSAFKRPKVIATLVALALTASIFITLRNKKDIEPPVIPAPTVVEPAVEGAHIADEEVFYDLKIADASAQVNEIAVFNTLLVVTDDTSGKIFVSDQNTAKFEPVQTTFVGIKNLINIKGKLGFTDTAGYKVYDLANQKLVEEYTAVDLGITSAYLDFVYSVQDSRLLRHSKGTGTLIESLWGQNDDFTGAKSVAISYSVYVLTTDGRLTKFTGGEKEEFSVTGVPGLNEQGAFSEPVQVLADIDFENVYIAEKGKSRVVSVDDKGNFVKEYLPKKEGAWKDIKSIGVSPDEKTLFVLTGSRVYKIAL